jgi:hypothetical protein
MNVAFTIRKNFDFLEDIYKYHLNLDSPKSNRFDNFARQPLKSSKDLDRYIGMYGPGHRQKLIEAFTSVDFRKFRGKVVETVSWECRGGLDSLVLMEHLSKNRIDLPLSRITLIDSCAVALDRGIDHLKNVLIDPHNTIEIRSRAKSPNSLTPQDISTNRSNVKLHVMSNFLDLPYVDLEKLANLVSQNMVGENLFICVGTNSPGEFNGKKRVDGFHALLARQFKIHEISANGQDTKTWNYSYRERKELMTHLTRYHRIFQIIK